MDRVECIQENCEITLMVFANIVFLMFYARFLIGDKEEVTIKFKTVVFVASFTIRNHTCHIKGDMKVLSGR